MENKALATQKQLEFTTDQIALIKSQIAIGATDDELKLFLYQAKRTGLDPLARQIYFVKRQGKGTIQTGIDGFRIIAERSNEYAGQDAPIFTETPGATHPDVCTVVIYRWRGETRYPAGIGVAYWSEYVPNAGQDFMWKKMPHTMLSKVAEALGLRKAFPQDLSGIYSDEEMEQASQSNVVTEKGIKKDLSTPKKLASKISLAQQKKIYVTLKEKGFSDDRLHQYIMRRFNKESITALTSSEAGEVITKLEGLESIEEEIHVDVEEIAKELDK